MHSSSRGPVIFFYKSRARWLRNTGLDRLNICIFRNISSQILFWFPPICFILTYISILSRVCLLTVTVLSFPSLENYCTQLLFICSNTFQFTYLPLGLFLKV
jgi:hypothetical protein